MRILVTLHNFVPEPTMGAETVAIAQMRELLRAGHRIALFYAGNAPPLPGQLSALGLPDLALFRVPYHPTKVQVLLSIRKPWIDRAFARVIRSFRPDVILFHHTVRLSLTLPLVAARAGIAVAYVLHDYYLQCPSYSLFAWDADVCPGGSPERCAQCLYRSRYGRAPPAALAAAAAAGLRWRDRLVRRVVHAVDLFISPSGALLEQAAARGLDLTPAVVVPNGQQPAERQALASRRDGAVRFGYIGAINRKKGVDLLVTAFSGELGRQLSIRGFKEAASLSAFREAHPEFRGRLEPFDPDRAAFFRAVDLVVVPSIWLENQPLVILEAFAHGRPVLASRIGGLPEMFRDGEGGRFFEPGDPASLRRLAQAFSADPSAVPALAAGIPRWTSWPEAADHLYVHLASLVRRSCMGPG
jgi:glycosyltransferase involved in cell wall biosynthesis